MSRKTEEPKQVLVMRRDIDMSLGKQIAQGSHASLGAYFKSQEMDPVSQAAIEWRENRFTKVVVGVKSLIKLRNVYEAAQAAGLPCVLIKDAGFTEFAEPTITCVGIGPAYPEEFIGVTDKLRLL